MLSPAKCEFEDSATAQLNLHSSSPSVPERLSLPNPEVSDEEAAQSSFSGEATKLSDGEMSERRSTKLNSNSELRKSPRSTNSCQVRRSPRFPPADGKIDNVCSVPVTGKSGSRKIEITSALLKKESLDSEGLSFKDIAAIAKNLEMDIESDCQVTNNDAEGRSQAQAKRKADSDRLSSSIKNCNRSLRSSKRTRRSPRFTEEDENIGKSKEGEKPVASRNPSKRSPKLSGIVENGNGETFNTSDCSAADNRVTEEMNGNSTVIHISDSDEETPAKNVQDSDGYLYTRSSNGAILIEDASECDGRVAPLDLSSSAKSTKGKGGARVTRTAAVREKHEPCNFFFVGEPIPCEEAQERWRWRYDLKERKSKSKGQQPEDDEDKIVANVECHYSQAKVDNQTFSLGDFACIKGDEKETHIGKVVEFFKTTDGESYFRVQWFYRATDTVMKQEATHHDKRRLFYSTVMNDNPIDCLISKVTVLQVSPRAGLEPKSIKSDFYFDMEYCVEYSTFRTLRNLKSSENKLQCCADVVPKESTESLLKNNCFSKELPVLDLYSGCGGMSTGLSLGAKISGFDVVTKWAVDQNLAACESLKLNHPQTQVRNDAAGDFLLLLKEWDKLCKRYVFDNDQTTDKLSSESSKREETTESSSSDDDSEPEEYEVEKLVDICYGDADNTGENGLKFKVHWKGYSSKEDTWEPAEELSNCEDAMREFVTRGFKSKILPLPGGVGVICGGPPCQGISGYNRHRNVDSPLTDEKNQQIIVFMDIVEYLKPAFVLMENVVDILRLDKGSLGRYALSRLVHMRYQARLGIMTAGCYGLSQFRSRVFMWGADPNKNLPPFPLPTHDVIVRYGFPQEFERNVVAYDEGQSRKVEQALVLQDAISDLPPVSNDEEREKMPYQNLPETDFQRYVRSTKQDLTGSEIGKCTKGTMLLHDHRPLHMFETDYIRVCQIPKKKGANFRDLPGLIVRDDNTVCRDPSMELVLLPSGRPLVPEYVFTFQQGKSKRPFGRLWWDETVPTVLTVPTCHSQTFLHPEQDRVLTIRESARLQGFPDYFQFCGTVKERYCQIGNAVAVSVSRALGYSLAVAFRGIACDDHLIKLPENFSHSTYLQLKEATPH
ncbi:unnamed protein product [Microthlaspi erraticum]|uniref:DNA (cytosine-5-)-methyltransferase n=1 Tax=Microthlaspi erraticum TaxID=1685480 RepID=A0A6D2KKC9_9BRAS|nr:unnamed protein product [Microthlaspi erraticum]